ncbi:BCCT family transporter, partial [Deltaproteobacteria bacterium OttesenSCG-928-K17]|nr:BCCT family transporter [Deltaproteobacteria bacterium OttesenSCG-928-K17]
MSQASAGRHFDPLITYVSGGLTIGFVAISLIFPSQMESAVNAAFGWTTTNLGWLYIVSVFGMTLTCLMMLFGRWNKYKLGPDDSKPEYTNFMWFGMLFGS